MPGSNIQATAKDLRADDQASDSSGDSDKVSATLKETQASSERMLVAIGKIERALDEKFKRDEETRSRPDPAIEALNAEIATLRSEIVKLNAENNQLNQAVNEAGQRLDSIIESLSAQLNEEN